MLGSFKKFAADHKGDKFVSYDWSDRVVRRGKQVFAVFGGIAYDVSKMKFNYDETCVTGTGKICVPVCGRYLAQMPDEGQSGIMGMYIINRKGKNVTVGTTFVPCGWLFTEELELTNYEIKENIFNDIARGENVFYPKPAGWY